MPWGESRYTYGTTPTTYKFTGQRLESGLGPSGAGQGLYFYGARWLDPVAGRFVSADTVIPEQQGVQAWDRYAYVNNNPVKYTDPSGHKMICEPEEPNCNQEARLEIIQNKVRNTQQRFEQKDHPFDASLCENNVKAPSEYAESTNQSIGGIIIAGVALTVGIVITEILLSWAEVAIIPVAIATPIVGVPMEALLIGCSLTLIDIDIAYWSYAARLYQNPNEIQEFELLPPWGLGGD